MPYTVSWKIEKHVLEARFWGELTEEEMQVVSREIAERFPIDGAPLYLVIDMYEVIKIPLNFNDLINDIATYRSMPRLPDGILIVSNNALMRFFGALVSKVMAVPLSALKAREEVDQFIMRQPDLAPLLPTSD